VRASRRLELELIGLGPQVQREVTHEDYLHADCIRFLKFLPSGRWHIRGAIDNHGIELVRALLKHLVVKIHAADLKIVKSIQRIGKEMLHGLRLIEVGRDADATQLR